MRPYFLLFLSIFISSSILLNLCFSISFTENVEALIEKNEPMTLLNIGRNALSKPHWRDHILLRKLSNSKEPTVSLIQ